MIKQAVAILLFAALVCSQSTPIKSADVQCIPAGVVDSDHYYIGYGQYGYKYSLPDLNLLLDKTYANSSVCMPATLNGNSITFGSDKNNDGSTIVSTADLKITSTSNSAAPFSPPYYINGNCSPLKNGEQYCFQNCKIQHMVGNAVTESVDLPSCTTDNNSQYVAFDSVIANRLQVTSITSQGRGSGNYHYYRLSLSPLAVVSGPVELTHTAISGCPVQPQQCAVPVLINFNIVNDIVSYIWTEAMENGDFQVTLQSYDAVCNQFFTTLLGQSSGQQRQCSTTSAPTTTGAQQTTTVAPTTTGAQQTTTVAPTTTGAATTTGAQQTTTVAPTTTGTVTTTGAVTTTTVAPTTTGAQTTTAVPQCPTGGNTQASTSCLANQSGGNNASRRKRQGLAEALLTAACSGNGNCVANNICVCKTGYYGVDCATPCSTVPPVNLSGNDNARSSGSKIVSVFGVVAAIAVALMI